MCFLIDGDTATDTHRTLFETVVVAGLTEMPEEVRKPPRWSEQFSGRLERPLLHHRCQRQDVPV